MNSKLSDWASIAEIVSGIGVVVTLIFLVVGIRENTEIARASMFERTLESVNQWRMDIAGNDSLLASFSLRDPTLDVTGWSEIDRLRLQFLVNSLWGIYEKAFYSREYGVIGDDEWARFETQICVQYESEVPALRDAFALFLTPRFIEYMKVRCRR
jgi:hypothetical protein